MKKIPFPHVPMRARDILGKNSIITLLETLSVIGSLSLMGNLVLCGVVANAEAGKNSRQSQLKILLVIRTYFLGAVV